MISLRSPRPLDVDRAARRSRDRDHFPQAAEALMESQYLPSYRLWVIEEGIVKTTLWRRAVLGSVAIREERVQAVPGIHFPSPDSTVHLLLPVPVVL
jgi:hypothetical protein